MNEMDFVNNNLKHKLESLEERWDVLVCKARNFEWGDVGLLDLARSCGTWWYLKRGNEPIARFLAYDGRKLSSLPNFGVKKIEKLCDIVSKSIEMYTSETSLAVPMAKIDASLSLEDRWNIIVSKARNLDWGDVGLRELARICDLNWYQVRGNESLAGFLVYDGNQLINLPSFGRKKIIKLCDIVSKAVEIWTNKSPMTTSLEKIEPIATLREWGVPEDFPCRLCLLPVRVLRHCEKHALKDVTHLIDEWQKHGFVGFMSMKNLGKKSVKELEIFVHALCDRDHATASLYLPLCPSGSGLSLPVALSSLAKLPKTAELQMLERRLIGRMTLEESAEEACVTRERVRQIEGGFLREIEERLDYFAYERNELLHAWVTGQDWFEVLRPMDKEELVKAAIEAIFDETPQACARDLSKESKWEAWREELRSHPDLWFGGVELDSFLADRVPVNQTEEFCECLTFSRELRLDHCSGRVLPVRTSLYLTVVAMLAREDDAIPLTWLVELLIQSGYHPTATKQTLMRHKRNWLARSDFENNKILWNE
jgi:hypothetical protein